jgi:hypothetical protein
MLEQACEHGKGWHVAHLSVKKQTGIYQLRPEVKKFYQLRPKVSE